MSLALHIGPTTQAWILLFVAVAFPHVAGRLQLSETSNMLSNNLVRLQTQASTLNAANFLPRSKYYEIIMYCNFLRTARTVRGSGLF